MEWKVVFQVSSDMMKTDTPVSSSVASTFSPIKDPQCSQYWQHKVSPYECSARPSAVLVWNYPVPLFNKVSFVPWDSAPTHLCYVSVFLTSSTSLMLVETWVRGGSILPHLKQGGFAVFAGSTSGGVWPLPTYCRFQSAVTFADVCSSLVCRCTSSMPWAVLYTFLSVSFPRLTAATEWPHSVSHTQGGPSRRLASTRQTHIAPLISAARPCIWSRSPPGSVGGTWTAPQWSGVPASSGLIEPLLAQGMTYLPALWEWQGYSARHIGFCACYRQKDSQFLSIIVDPICQKELFELFGVLFPVLCVQLEVGLQLCWQP